MTGTMDPALAVVMDACRTRLYAAASTTINAEAAAMHAEGHAPAIVGTVMISVAASLLFSALLTQVCDEHRESVAQDAVDGLMAHLAAFEAGALPGVTLQ